MTWAKLPDEYPNQCAEAGLSDAAFRTHTEAVFWIYGRDRPYGEREKITMRIPKGLLPRFAGSPDRDLAAKELVGIGWWKEHATDYEVVKHAATIRQSIQRQRQVRDGNRDRKARQRGRSDGTGRQKGASDQGS